MTAAVRPTPVAAARSPWRLAWRAMTADRTARVALLVLAALYIMVALADVVAPYGPQWADRRVANAPPTAIYTVDAQTGQLTWPYVFRYTRQRDPASLTLYFASDRRKTYPVQLWVKGEPYRLFGLLPMDRHLIGVEAPARLALLGNDLNGRDLFSRLLFGGRISLTIGFLSLLIVIPLGLLYGGISGYRGGWVDGLMMRSAEILMSIPKLYLLISLAAILPTGLSSVARFALVTLILAGVGWAELARVVRGMVLSIKTQEFVEASRAIGCSPLRVIVRHVLPQTASFVVVAATVGVPGYLLAESGLSFLGLGIQQPDASWGNLLKDAQDLSNVLYAPWMLAPGVLIALAVLAFNVLGDAVRDALDPKRLTGASG